MSKISVVMPVYNVEQYVGAAIQSVLNQSFPDFELIIVNDCSPDGSIEICEQFDDPRINIIHHKTNRGLAGARNTGIRHATSDYIAFLDSDDIWAIHKLEQHYAHLEQDSGLGISFSRSAFIDENGERTNAYQMPALKSVSAGYYLCRNPIGNGSAPVIRRQVFEEIAFEHNLYGATETGYFDENFRQSEDIECWIRIRTTTTWRIEGLSESLTLYRLNSGGLSADIPKQLASWEAVIAKVDNYAPELVNRYGKLARAYQLRYLCRQAIRLNDGTLSVQMINKALACHPGILYYEPLRTVTTLGAAYVQFLLPSTICKVIAPFVVQIIGRLQALRISVQSVRMIGG